MAAKVVSPAEIENALESLWDSFEGSKTRAQLFNLIFYTKKKTRTEYFRNIAQKVIEKFPSRIIFITVEPANQEAKLQTAVSVLIAAKGEHDIGCDLIEINVSGKEEEKIPFVILPHLLPDLPIYAIWAEDPTQESMNQPLFLQLKKLCTRLIFDSECTESLSQFASSLLSIYQSSQIDIADLNWGRMESWRDLLSSTFYTQERLEELHQTKQMQICYNARETQFYCHTLIQSIYLQGWLACQLGWNLKQVSQENNQLNFTYQKLNGIVNISLFAEYHENIGSGAIVSVDLTTENEHHFSFGRNLEFPHQVSMRFSTLEKCEIPLKYIFSKAESGQSLVKEISHKRTSSHYLALLNVLKTQKEFNFRANRKS